MVAPFGDHTTSPQAGSSRVDQILTRFQTFKQQRYRLKNVIDDVASLKTPVTYEFQQWKNGRNGRNFKLANFTH